MPAKTQTQTPKNAASDEALTVAAVAPESPALAPTAPETPTLAPIELSEEAEIAALELAVANRRKALALKILKPHLAAMTADIEANSPGRVVSRIVLRGHRVTSAKQVAALGVDKGTFVYDAIIVKTVKPREDEDDEGGEESEDA